jgi:hypothetical protein
MEHIWLPSNPQRAVVLTPQSEEDYTYFTLRHLDTTLFGISCTRQMLSSELHARPADVTRSTIQKAIVVLARKPVFGPIREKLGVVTRAWFLQRDFEVSHL